MNVEVSGELYGYAREGRWHANHALHRVTRLGLGLFAASAHLVATAETGCGEIVNFPELTTEVEVPTHPRCRRGGCK